MKLRKQSSSHTAVTLPGGLAANWLQQLRQGCLSIYMTARNSFLAQ